MNLVILAPLLVAWQPAVLARQHVTLPRQSDSLPRQHAPCVSSPAIRTSGVSMVVPKFVALAAFVPWTFVIIVNNLPTELRLKVQKSNLIQSGAKMRSMKRDPPKLRGVRLPLELEEITQTFKKEYPRKELEILWAALLNCYGSKELALEAARTNPQIANPSYSFCNTMLESKRILLGVMSESQALEVMRKNPAVLQCGPTLEALGRAEIEAFAAARGFGSQLPESIRNVAIAGLLIATILPVALAQNPMIAADSELLSASKALAAAVVAPTFAGAIFYLLLAGGRK